MNPKTPTTIPSLSPGKLIKGPEALGCFNTGTRPMLLHSKDGLWYVGVENDVDTLKSLRLAYDIRRGMGLPPMKHKGLNASATTFKNGSRVAKCFRTRKPAVQMFRELLSQRLDMNDILKAGAESAIAKTKSSDPVEAIQGAMELLAY